MTGTVEEGATEEEVEVEETDSETLDETLDEALEVAETAVEDVEETDTETEVEEVDDNVDKSELVETEPAGAFWYTLRRWPPPQYSVALSRQVTLHSLIGADL
jgi:hypothetical protein